MKKGLTLLSLLSILALAAGEASALTAYPSNYTAAGPDVCASGKICGQPADTSKVGCFNLAGVAADKQPTRDCSIGSACAKSSAACPVLDVAGLVVKPVAAVLNDAVILLGMPYQKSERLS
ncbi:MAG: hypothetical protein KBD07_06430 [Candidatus Omnitrophica bacterium]|nr:hypothetical protein [Candidatus Omnitrophota bacterium]